MSSTHFLIVGSGLIGTSIALALVGEGHTVSLEDADSNVLRLAQDLIGKNSVEKTPDYVIVATPPDSIFPTIQAKYQLYPHAIFIDVGSTKNKLILDVERFSELSERFVGTHPMAGREFSGAASAQADLFHGRAWIVVPTSRTLPKVLTAVTTLIETVGATVYQMDGLSHDQLLARISHLPQALSTALAGSLLDVATGMELSGQGLRDTTRLADSSGELWSEIFIANKGAIIDALDLFSAQLQKLRSSIESNDVEQIVKLFNEGKKGRSRVSGKHGAQPRDYVYLMIVIKDEPGALKTLFEECAEVNANIEDLSIEHSPKQETGLITLAFSPGDSQRVLEHLHKRNWKVHAR